MWLVHVQVEPVHEAVAESDSMQLTIIAVISTVLYLTKGEHTVFYKINNNVYIKTSKIINDIVIILQSSLSLSLSHTHTHTHTILLLLIKYGQR